MADRRLLISLAHPDDESFGSGGLIARYVAEGVDVYLICATNGESGTVSPDKLNGYNSIAELRLSELACAAQTLGLKEVIKLGYKDSGMMNSETSKDPASLWQAPREQVARRVVEVIRAVRPQAVITFNEYGGYGHPDHIAIQRATVDAFTLAGDANYVTEGQLPYQPQKLYYTAIPTFWLYFWVNMMRLRRQDPRKVGRNRDIDLVAILDHVRPVHTRVDVSKYFAIWEAANQCHASQLEGGPPRLPMVIRKLFYASTTLTRIHPRPSRDRVDERDVFAGVHVDEPVPA